MYGAHHRGIHGLLGGRPRNTEIRHLHHAIFTDDHILRLDVPVYDAHFMGLFHTVDHLQRDADGLPVIQLALPLNVIFQGNAADQLHHNVMQPLRFVIHHVIGRHNIRMVQLGRRLRLILELPYEVFVLAVLFLQHLDGNLASHFPVQGTIYIAHAALADHGFYFIALV